MWKSFPPPPDRLVDAVQEQKSNTFKINVYARFRPSAHSLKKQSKIEAVKPLEASDDAAAAIEVNLPLHQRLAMIKLSHKLTSNKEALKVLATEGGWFHKKWTSVNVKGTDVRIVDENEDPSNIPKFREKMEKDRTFASVQSVDTDTSRVVMIAPDVGLRFVAALQ